MPLVIRPRCRLEFALVCVDDDGAEELLHVFEDEDEARRLYESLMEKPWTRLAAEELAGGVS